MGGMRGELVPARKGATGAEGDLVFRRKHLRPWSG